MAAQKGTVERLRQSGVGALSNAFGMAAFLESKQNLVFDHPSLFILSRHTVDNQIDICIYKLRYIHTSHILSFFFQCLFVCFCLDMYKSVLEDSTMVLSNPWEYCKPLDLQGFGHVR